MIVTMLGATTQFIVCSGVPKSSRCWDEAVATQNLAFRRMPVFESCP